MTRNATPQFDSFDPEVMEAARDVAARAGVPLETWIASVVPQQGSARNRRRYRSGQAAAGDPRPEAARESEAARPSPGPARHAQGGTDAFDPNFAALMSRLDGLDRARDEERWTAQIAENRRLAEIEARIERALKAGPAPEVTERLGEIERRVSQLGEQFAASRPPGRRGRAAAEEIRDAVHDIRQRQHELSHGRTTPSEGSVVASMRRDLARRLEVQAEDAAASSAALTELQRETARLREAVNGLASTRDVGALEQAVISLAAGVQRAEIGTDLTVIAVPIERVRVQVERLAESVAGDVHERVADDVRRLSGRLDTIAASGAPGADRTTLTDLFAELDEIRGLLGTLAAPERIQLLVQGLHAVSEQIARVQDAGGLDSGLRPLLEEIRSDVRSAAPAVLAEQIQALAGKVDTLCARAERLDRAGVAVETTPGGSPELGSIHAMLSSLAEKVERVGSGPASEGFDALERQVMSLADRIDTPSSGDPAFASLERTMGDLLRQVTALREAAPSEEAVERATRDAVTQSLKGSGLPASDPGEIGLLRASLADMQARQIAADRRLGATLEGVQSALDRLVTRLGPTESADPRPVSLDQRLMATTGVEAPPAPGSQKPAAGRDPSFDLSQIADGLLEPGLGRPARAAKGEIARRGVRDRSREPGTEPMRDAARGRDLPEAGPDGDIKTSFIAAARRAAQAAQAELAAEVPTERREPRGRLDNPAAVAESRLGRLRAEIDRRRRPLLLGLAAIVLALGALQAISMNSADEAARRAPVAQAAPVAAPKDEAARTEAPKDEATKGEMAKAEAAKGAAAEAGKDGPKPAAQDPLTTQSLGSTAPAPAPRPTVPQVAGMNTLTADLGTLPAGLAKTKQAALDGDGSAIWDLASREADGRGMPRDLSLAAKLYEKLAVAGYAPAQYKVAGQYEKGAGLVRDLDKAKLWYGRAAEQGHARSMHNLAVIYAENPAANGKPDFASAASWFRQGAEYGVRDSQYNLAVLYARGLGLTTDLVQSYIWFSAAAGQGDDEAAKKRDEVTAKLSPSDLAAAKSLVASFKPRKLDAAVNDPPAPRDAVTAPMSLLGAPSPSANAFTPPARRTM